MDKEIHRYEARHWDQVVGLFEDLQDYVTDLDPYG